MWIKQSYRTRHLPARIFTSERANAILAALIIIGLALILVGVWRYVDAAQQLAGNSAQAIQQGEAPLDIETPEQAQGLIASDLERRRLERQQNEALVMGGVGLATLALGWLAHDLVQARRKTKPTAPPSPAEEGT